MAFKDEFSFMLSCFSAWVWDGQPELMTYDAPSYNASLMLNTGHTLVIFPHQGSLVYRMVPPP